MSQNTTPAVDDDIRDAVDEDDRASLITEFRHRDDAEDWLAQA